MKFLAKINQNKMDNSSYYPLIETMGFGRFELVAISNDLDLVNKFCSENEGVGLICTEKENNIHFIAKIEKFKN